jgi:hypothetical protein
VRAAELDVFEASAVEPGKDLASSATDECRCHSINLDPRHRIASVMTVVVPGTSPGEGRRGGRDASVTLDTLVRPFDVEGVVKRRWLIPALIVVAVLAFIGVEIWFGITQAR